MESVGLDRARRVPALEGTLLLCNPIRLHLKLARWALEDTLRRSKSGYPGDKRGIPECPKVGFLYT